MSGPAARSESGGRGRDGRSSTSCNMLVRAASTIASESRLGCERSKPRDPWDDKKGGWTGGRATATAAAAAVRSPSDATEDDEIGLDAAAESSSGGASTAVSNT